MKKLKATLNLFVPIAGQDEIRETHRLLSKMENPRYYIKKCAIVEESYPDLMAFLNEGKPEDKKD